MVANGKGRITRLREGAVLQRQEGHPALLPGLGGQRPAGLCVGIDISGAGLDALKRPDGCGDMAAERIPDARRDKAERIYRRVRHGRSAVDRPVRNVFLPEAFGRNGKRQCNRDAVIRTERCLEHLRRSDGLRKDAQSPAGEISAAASDKQRHCSPVTGKRTRSEYARTGAKKQVLMRLPADFRAGHHLHSGRRPVRSGIGLLTTIEVTVCEQRRRGLETARIRQDALDTQPGCQRKRL